MELQISGLCTQVFDKQVTSKQGGQTRTKHFFVIRTDEQYARTVCFVCWKDEQWQRMQISAGHSYCVSFNAESHEYNGNYYTDLVAWKAISLNNGQQVQQPSNASAPQAPPQSSPMDNLPY